MQTYYFLCATRAIQCVPEEQHVCCCGGNLASVAMIPNTDLHPDWMSVITSKPLYYMQEIEVHACFITKFSSFNWGCSHNGWNSQRSEEISFLLDAVLSDLDEACQVCSQLSWCSGCCSGRASCSEDSHGLTVFSLCSARFQRKPAPV